MTMTMHIRTQNYIMCVMMGDPKVEVQMMERVFDVL